MSWKTPVHACNVGRQCGGAGEIERGEGEGRRTRMGAPLGPASLSSVRFGLSGSISRVKGSPSSSPGGANGGGACAGWARVTPGALAARAVAVIAATCVTVRMPKPPHLRSCAKAMQHHIICCISRPGQLQMGCVGHARSCCCAALLASS